ncbi:hypothetical protein LTR84_009079 [Exophiala bonariae]|uniref:Sugar phosphate transporter domain-containing protein n=1 Tax=Exophiala bonariae TaxID=1690606 RepID=A0AAV9MWQ3_9EURO|nr:hypothetical protein LTR84_009079 [Exophiala bonariae]
MQELPTAEKQNHNYAAVATNSEEADVTASTSNQSQGDVHITFILLLCWVMLSSGLIMFNKYIIGSLDFAYPTTLVFWHCVCTMTATQLIARCTNKIDTGKQFGTSTKKFFGVIVPIGLMFTGSLIFNNLPYLTLNVAFIQMIKSLGPATIVFALYTLRLATPSYRECIAISLIIAGFLFCMLGEIKFSLKGTTYQVLGLLFEAYRGGLTQKCFTQEERLDPLAFLYYFAPVSTLAVGTIAAATEWQGDIWGHTGEVWSHVQAIHPSIFAANGAMAFSLNIVITALLKRTGALTIPLLGLVRTVLVMVGSVVIWNTVVTPLQLFGFFITVNGLVWYYVLKARKQ